MTYQIEALGMLVHVDPLEFRKISENCGKFMEILEKSKNSLHWGAGASKNSGRRPPFLRVRDKNAATKIFYIP